MENEAKEDELHEQQHAEEVDALRAEIADLKELLKSARANRDEALAKAAAAEDSAKDIARDMVAEEEINGPLAEALDDFFRRLDIPYEKMGDAYAQLWRAYRGV